MQEFNQKLDNLQALKAALETKKTTELKKRFETALQGRFSEVPNGNFMTRLPDVESVAITRQQGGGGLSVDIFYDSGKRHETFTLAHDGTLLGRIPDRFPVDRQQITEEIIRIAESIDIEAWRQVPDNILPEGFWEKKPEGTTSAKKIKKRPGTNPEKVAFMRTQDDFLFGFVGDNFGFRNYYGSVFPWGIVLENDDDENAAYFIDFPEQLQTADAVRAPLPKVRLSPKEVEQLHQVQDAVLKKYWSPHANMSKFEARKRGLHYFVHRGPNWKNSLDEELQKRRP